MAQARLAIGGLLLLLGVANIAVLDFHLAPRYAEEVAAAARGPTNHVGTASTSTGAPTPKTAAKPELRASSAPVVSAASSTNVLAASSASASAAPPPSATAVAVATTEPSRPESQQPSASAPEPLPDLSYELDSFRFTQETALVLEKAVKLLQEQPKLRILIRGHSDKLGSPEYNIELSRRRASAVENYLIEHGVAADKISIEAVGGKEPMDSSNSPVAWARNRRVQMVWR